MNLNDVIFVCIGTDRSTGDAYGPLVGSELKRRGYTNVYGDIDNPVHATNLHETIEKLPKGKTVIGIDACLGQLSSVERIDFMKKGPIKPGAGVGKDLPHVGDYHITGVVNVGGFMEYFVLQNTRLSTVLKMVNETANRIDELFSTQKEVAAG